jgi:uncharacterized membrane protein
MFSFILGDLHPHVMALPIVLVAVGTALTFYRSREPLDITFWLQRPAALVMGAMVVGGLAFIHVGLVTVRSLSSRRPSSAATRASAR